MVAPLVLLDGVAGRGLQLVGELGVEDLLGDALRGLASLQRRLRVPPIRLRT